MIRLYVIEDHITLTISGFKYLFRSKRDGITISGYSGSVEETIKSADPEDIDLFILDLHIPGTYPIDNIRNLRRHFPGKPIVIYTSELSDSWRKKMIEEGAISYITKDTQREELKLVILKAVKGETVTIGKQRLTYLKEQEEGSPMESEVIIPINREILRLLIKGLNHKEIGKEVSLSRTKVENILKEMRDHFHVKTNLELIKILSKADII
jgi:DNA-binding NarL/FixJ family response regulator